MKSIASLSVLDYLRQLPACVEHPSTDGVLHDLAHFYGADGIGLGHVHPSMPDLVVSGTVAPPKPYPWHKDGDLLKRMRASLSAELHQDDAGDWLVTLVGEPMNGDAIVVWAYRAKKRGWTDQDQWSWMVVSQALVRWWTRTAGATAPRQQRLEQAAIVAGRLTHDFGNYLTGIMGFTELSLLQTPAGTLMHRYLQEVLQSARQGAEWIRRLHLFCRRLGKQAWPTPLASILAEEEALLRSAGVLNLRWVTNLPNELPLVAMDAGALQSAVGELVSNSREATMDQGTITFTARVRSLTEGDCRDLLGTPLPGEYIELTVADDGAGILPDDRDKLFREIFYSTKPRHRGLGLLVVYGILHRFGGGLRIAPTPATGTTVQMYLPAATMEPSSSAAEPTQVLLVHSNPLLYESMRKILEANGYRVSVAISAPTAFTAYVAPGQSFALVITDVLLPPLPGFDLARRLLDYDPKANFLFLHTQSSFHGLAEEELLKRFALLRWPMQPQNFVAAVQTALAQGRK